MTEPANYVQQVHPRLDDPSCNVCGAQMVPSGYKCLSCGKVEVGDRALETAWKWIDWQQVVLNGGPPCFYVEHGKFCLRAERWHIPEATHDYVSLADLIQSAMNASDVKWQLYERDYILPQFEWAKERGIDLQQLVKDNPGKNCSRLFYEAMNAQERELRSKIADDVDAKMELLLDAVFEKKENAIKVRDVMRRTVMGEAERLLAERGEGR